MRQLGKPVWLVTAALVALSTLVIIAWIVLPGSDRLNWSMIHVSGDSDDGYSGDAHLLQLPDGHIVLIDTGFARFTARDLVPFLRQRGVDHIDDLIITHAHRNHYGGIKELFQRLRSVGKVYFNLPPRAPCDRETWSTGCNYQHVLDTRALIERSPARLLSLHTGDVIYQSADAATRLSVVYVHDGQSPPIGDTDINDTSAVLRLVHGDNTVLFTGDLNRKVGAYLVKQGLVPRAVIMTAPHHGVESAAPNSFLEKVGAKVFMVSDSAGNWLGERAERMRRFVRDNNLNTYVTGLHGNVIVSMDKKGYSISSQRSVESR